MTKPELAKKIEYTFLKPDTDLSVIRKLVAEAQEHGFLAICIPPLFCRDARRLLGESSPVRLATVVGFPMGYAAIAAKSEEIKRAVDEGADDIDAVINIAAVKSGLWNLVENDIDSMARASHMRGRQLKLILECGLLTDAEIQRLCKLAHDYQAAYVKSSTGFFGITTTTEMIRTLKNHTVNPLKIKASGGIVNYATAISMLEAGADCIGTSSAVAIINGINNSKLHKKHD